MKEMTILWMFLLCAGCAHKETDKLVFPYSQWTVGTGSQNISWHFQEGFEYNNSFIKAPAEGEWEPWFEKIVAYRELVRENAGKVTPYLHCDFSARKESRIHFDQFSYQLMLMPGEEIEIEGKSKSPDTGFVLYFDFDLKYSGEELSYVIRDKKQKTDSLLISSSGDWKTFTKAFKVPGFPSDSFAIAPVITIKTAEKGADILLKDIRLKVVITEKRRNVLNRMAKYLERQANNSAIEIPDELSWTHHNFVMGFVFIWDAKFWDAEKGEYTVDSYCETMNREFGGIQSVVLWHSYPNIGVDERNQFDMLRDMPGGMIAVRHVINDFHRNGVKVFITYNPWDLDTRRPGNHDFTELAGVIDESGADGIYLDTWRCSIGVISVFEVENSIRDELAKSGKQVAFATEIMPELKDLYGDDALTSSWGQEIHPFHFTDLSHLKWIMPQHKQHYIRRMTKDRKQILAHAWINGQGIQVWENIFGTMNLWSANQRRYLRKMNTIWDTYGNLYITDNWKPFIPVSGRNILASQWEKNDYTITNFVNTAQSDTKFKMEVEPDETYSYFDLWKGTELKTLEENGKTFVELNISNFGCFLETGETDSKLRALLRRQAEETGTPLPVKDEYDQELSLKETVNYDYKKSEGRDFETELIPVEGGEHIFTCKHIWREGRCYPDMDASHNHDLVLAFEDGAQRIIHTHREIVSPYSIMSRVVTNAQFEEFIETAGYIPRFEENFLKHWGGSTCPESMKSEPVVYVSLEDARAFAEWAGMQLPTEWEWQLAAETHKEDFIYNEVFELNESERFDGFNRSLSLRGGCSRWTTSSSWWYLPGAPRGEKAGGPQKHNSHVKYFLMYPGMDRTSTIGFRCVQK